jgi:hypothetical protein
MGFWHCSCQIRRSSSDFTLVYVSSVHFDSPTRKYFPRLMRHHTQGTAPAPTLHSCHDKALADGVWLLRLCEAVAPHTVDWSLVTFNAPSESPEAKLNAQYALSVVRKIGACVFLTPEDIMELKPKMIFTFMASIWLAEEAHKGYREAHGEPLPLGSPEPAPAPKPPADAAAAAHMPPPADGESAAATTGAPFPNCCQN